jgi:hypothetical protein
MESPQRSERDAAELARLSAKGAKVTEAVDPEIRQMMASVAQRHLDTDLAHWYVELAPCWLAAKPRLRRRLLLRTHQWIAERVLGSDADASAAADDLAPEGALVRALSVLVPDEEREQWRHWIRLVVGDLRRALLRPRAERNAAWAHWLFLIPYGIPLSGGASRGRDW